MDQHPALGLLFFGCFVLMCLSILNRISMQLTIVRHNKALTAMLHRMGRLESHLLTQGDDLAQLNGELHELRLNAEGLRRPATTRLGIDARGRG